MKNSMILDYFYGQTGELFSFYRIPKALFQEPRFQSLSTDAKTLYGILLDRMSLSVKNGWLDEQNRVFIIFTIEDVKRALCCADNKATKLLRELEKFGLIERKRRGLGKPSLVYTRMKIVIINGSARKGNTLAAINAFIKGASEKNKIEIIEPDKLNIAPCKGCGVCQCSKGCVDKDDTNPTIDKIAAADMILFATPVYWWGMSAQLKLIIDKCYCRGLQLKNKKVGTIVVGGSPVDSIQYELIDKQFDCMAKYLSWDMLFKKSYYATARDELEKNKDSMNELEWIGKNL